MIRLDNNLNSVVHREATVTVDQLGSDRGEATEMVGEEDEFAINGDDDEVEDPELDFSNVRLGCTQANGERATARNSNSLAVSEK